MALVAAVMSSSLAGYLEKTIKIEASCQNYARALVDRGYETPERFHTLSSRVLVDSFAWKPEHVKQVEVYTKANQDIIPRKRKREATGPAEKVSKFLGVSWNKGDMKWRVGIFHDHRKIGLGRFDNEAEAARTYDAEARKLKGARARLNFPNTGEIQGHGRMLRTPAEVRLAREIGAQKSQYRGVCWDKQRCKWKAQIKDPVANKVKHLGLFIDEELAARSYDDAERSMHPGEAKINFPLAGEEQAVPRNSRSKEEVQAAKAQPARKSSYRGVTWDATRGKWKTSIKHRSVHDQNPPQLDSRRHFQPSSHLDPRRDISDRLLARTAAATSTSDVSMTRRRRAARTTTRRSASTVTARSSAARRPRRAALRPRSKCTHNPHHNWIGRDDSERLVVVPGARRPWLRRRRSPPERLRRRRSRWRVTDRSVGVEERDKE